MAVLYLFSIFNYYGTPFVQPYGVPDVLNFIENSAKKTCYETQ